MITRRILERFGCYKDAVEEFAREAGLEVEPRFEEYVKPRRGMSIYSTASGLFYELCRFASTNDEAQGWVLVSPGGNVYRLDRPQKWEPLRIDHPGGKRVRP